MILILSRQDDSSTAFVIQWLLSLKKKYLRLNADTYDTVIKYLDINRQELIVTHRGEDINLFDATSLWYRRRGLSLNSVQINKKTYNQPVMPDEPDYHKQHMKTEISVFIEFIHYALEKRCEKKVGSAASSSVNKLHVLDLAKMAGLMVPETYVVTSREDLRSLLENVDGGIITKALSDGVYTFTKERGYYSYTEKLTTENIHTLPDHFFPSLLQMQISKKFELRVFYLKGTFYAMAIFSQRDKKTAVDFRKYNTEKPNRQVPFQLPEIVMNKLRIVMEQLSLDTGSIDLIVDENNDYVFLEVNPIGQFSMTSVPCNYYLERKIAALL